MGAFRQRYGPALCTCIWNWGSADRSVMVPWHHTQYNVAALLATGLWRPNKTLGGSRLAVEARFVPTFSKVPRLHGYYAAATFCYNTCSS